MLILPKIKLYSFECSSCRAIKITFLFRCELLLLTYQVFTALFPSLACWAQFLRHFSLNLLLLLISTLLNTLSWKMGIRYFFCPLTKMFQTPAGQEVPESCLLLTGKIICKTMPQDQEVKPCVTCSSLHHYRDDVMFSELSGILLGTTENAIRASPCKGAEIFYLHRC